LHAARLRNPRARQTRRLHIELLEQRALLTASTADTTFGSGGVALTPVGTGNSDALAAALQSNGDVVVVGGTVASGGKTDVALVRYQYSGALDTSFGSSGTVISSFSTGNDEANAVAIQADGKIVVGGYTSVGGVPEMLLARYTSAGALDTTFGGGNGYVTLAIGSSAGINSIVILGNGQIVVGGSGIASSTQEFALARFNADGSLDTTFGGSSKGYVLTDIETGDDSIAGIALETNGEIVAGGVAYNGTDYDGAMALYTAAGVLDTSFDSTGVATLNVSNDDAITGIAVQSNGQIVFVGYSTPGGAQHTLVGRYNVNGTLDSTFGTLGGYSLTGIDTADTAVGVQLDLEGRIDVFGTTTAGSGTAWYFARYTSTGALDTEFTTTGTVESTVGTASAQASAMLIDGNGRLMGFGAAVNGTSTADFAAVRLGTTYDLEGNTLYIHGTAGNDTVMLSFSSATQLGFYVDGASQVATIGTATNDVNQIIFEAGAGTNTVIVDDPYDTDTVAQAVDQMSFSNSTFQFTSLGTASQYFYGTASDTVTMTDGGSSNNFVNTGTYSTFAGTGWYNEAAGVGAVTATAASTTDTAYFYSVSGAKIVSKPLATTLTATSLSQTANGFGTVLALGCGDGTDNLYLYGPSTGVNAFCGTQLYGYMSGSVSGSAYFDVGEFFAHVYAYSGGGDDFAYFYDEAGTTNTFIGKDGDSSMAGTGYHNEAYGFTITLGVGSSTSTDTATIYDAAGTNDFFEAGSYGLMVSPDDQISVTGIASVDAVSEYGSSDAKFDAAIDYNLTFTGNWT